MRASWNRLAAGLLVATVMLMLGAAPACASGGPVNRAFAGGEISQLAINDGPTQGSFANLSYEYKACGTQVGETACTWRIDVGLAPEGFELCPSTSDPLATIWTSGEQSANGVVASGPKTFALRGTPGQVLCVVLHHTTAGEYEGWKFNAGGSESLEAVLMGPELISPIEAIERRIITASPPAPVGPPPHSVNFAVSSSCQAVTIGDATYVFAYRRIGCWKATNLATMAHLSRAAPNGYRCASMQGGGKRCWRRGHPRKYFEWHVPRNRSMASAG